ncbi:MAG: 1-acyl-sn-glycerol-3-phosphate acyltransferase [Anaerolineae bacterium]|nr:1-acyl-sn-glycerol-3-phosphate acyltransferase [Anaerolineae bacterium]
MADLTSPRRIPRAHLALLWLLRLVFRLYFRFECSGREHLVTALQSGQPVIPVSNHASHLDLMAVTTCIGPGLLGFFRFPGKAELFDNRFAAWLLAGMGAFPLERDAGDVAAARTLIKALRAGEHIGITPEGTRSRTGEVGPFKNGFVRLALKFDALVVPTAIVGTFRALPKGASFPRPGKVRVTIGEPIRLTALDVPGEGEARYDALAEYVRQAVIRLKDGG